MAKFRKHPDSEWPGFGPFLKPEHIRQLEYFGGNEHLVQSMVENQKGRIIVTLEHEDYQKFLKAVRSKHGDMFAETVNRVAREAVMKWTEENLDNL
ncbi:MAG: hypothetical protein ACFFCW_18480 [Candidatus Hodarchaeota archaeon]